jgi:hypothetical protein
MLPDSAPVIILEFSHRWEKYSHLVLHIPYTCVTCHLMLINT